MTDMAYLLTDAAILREIEETPTQPGDVGLLFSGSNRTAMMKQIRRMEAEGRLYRKKWHGLTVYGVNWYPQGEKDESAAA